MYFPPTISHRSHTRRALNTFTIFDLCNRETPIAFSSDVREKERLSIYPPVSSYSLFVFLHISFCEISFLIFRKALCVNWRDYVLVCSRKCFIQNQIAHMQHLIPDNRLGSIAIRFQQNYFQSCISMHFSKDCCIWIRSKKNGSFYVNAFEYAFGELSKKLPTVFSLKFETRRAMCTLIPYYRRKS